MQQADPRRRTNIKPIAIPVDEALRVSGLGKTKVFELIKEGKLKSVAVGRRRLVIYESLEALLQPEAV